MKTLVKKAVRCLRRLFSGTHKTAAAVNLRKDLVQYPVQDHVCLTVFWKVLDVGRGPATSLYIHGLEVLKFDCFGEHQGHYHIALRGDEGASQIRLFLPEPTVEEQIDRMWFELTTNLDYYLQRNPDPRVRKTRVAPENIEKLRAQIKATMLEYQGKAMSHHREAGTMTKEAITEFPTD